MDYPTDIKGEMPTTMPYACMVDDSHEIKVCVVCGERASGFYFGALVCLPCKVGEISSCDGMFTHTDINKQTTTYTSAKFKKKFHPSYIILRIKRLAGKKCRSKKGNSL